MGMPGATSASKVSTVSPPANLTAPISMTASCSACRPVVSRSRATRTGCGPTLFSHPSPVAAGATPSLQMISPQTACGRIALTATAGARGSRCGGDGWGRAREQAQQRLARRAGGSPAMADGVLLVGRQLGNGAAERRDEEDGVVAEAAGAAWLACDGAFERAFDDLIEAVWARLGQRDGAAIARGALVVGDGGQAAEEDAEAFRIGRRLAGPTGGVDARLATQRVNLEAGVVREGGEV